MRLKTEVQTKKLKKLYKKKYIVGQKLSLHHQRQVFDAISCDKQDYRLNWCHFQNVCNKVTNKNRWLRNLLIHFIDW